MFVGNVIVAETHKMYICRSKLNPKGIQLGIRNEAGGIALISVGNAKKVSQKVVNYLQKVMSENRLSPEEKSLMLKALYK